MTTPGMAFGQPLHSPRLLTCVQDGTFKNPSEHCSSPWHPWAQKDQGRALPEIPCPRHCRGTLTHIDVGSLPPTTRPLLAGLP